MADIPLYPGYIPEPLEEATPLYPGYFPGTPVPRMPPTPPTGFVHQFNIDFEAFMAQLNRLEYDMTLGGSGMPGWVKERLIDDFFSQFKAVYSPSKPGSGIYDIPQERLDEYDPNELPGAYGLSINLDPRDWAKDPNKAAKNLAKQWGKAVFNWTDVETRVRENLWNQVVKETPEYYKVVGGEDFLSFKKRNPLAPPPPAPIAEATAGVIIGRTAKNYTLAPLGTTNPLGLIPQGYDRPFEENLSRINILTDPLDGQIKAAYPTYHKKDLQTPGGTDKRNLIGEKLQEYEEELDAKGRKTGHKVLDRIRMGAVIEEVPETLTDKLASVGYAVVRFEKFQGSPLTRDGNFDTFSRSWVEAVMQEFEEDNIRKVIRADKDKQLAFAAFKAKAQIIDDTQKIGKAHVYLMRDLTKYTLEGKDWGDIDKVIGANGSYTKKIDAAITHHEAIMANLKREDPFEYARVEKMTRGYREHLEKMRGLSLDLAGTGGDRLRVHSLMGKLNTTATGGFIGKGISGGDLIVSSYQRKMLSSLSAEFLKESGPGVGSLLTSIERETGGPIRVSRLRAYVDRLRYERDTWATDELLDQLERGGLLETFLWPRVKKYIEYYTPAFFAQRTFKRLHYFGLVVDQDHEDDLEKGVFRIGKSIREKILKKRGYDTDGPGAIFGNWFKLKTVYIEKGQVSVARSSVFGTTVDPVTGAVIRKVGKTIQTIKVLSKEEYLKARVRGGDVQEMTIKRSIYGGKHFEGVDRLASIITMMEKGQWTPEAIRCLVMEMPSNGLNNAAFLAKLTKLNNGRMPIFPGKLNPHEMEEFRVQVIAFRDYVDKNMGGLADKDAAFWVAFITALRQHKSVAGAVAITRKFSGILEKLGALMNRVQNEILARIGKFLAPVAYFKTIITEAITNLTIKALSALAGAVSGGSMALVTETLGRFLKPIIRWVVNKTVATASAFVHAILKGDLFEFVETVDKMIQKSVRVVLIILAIPVVVLLMINTMFMGTTLTTYSPVDPSAVTALTERGAGPGDLMAPNTDCATLPDDNTLSGITGQPENTIPGYSKTLASTLIRGVWCFFNHNTVAPYDSGIYWDPSNPTWPDPSTFQGEIFWCTYLVLESYKKAGIIIPGYPAYSPSMAAEFGYTGTPYISDVTPPWKYISNRSSRSYSFQMECDPNSPGLETVRRWEVCNSSDTQCGTALYRVKPGDVIFFVTPGSCYGRISHVGIVYSTSYSDHIDTVHSNSSQRGWTYGLVDNIVQDDPRMEVWGFGRYETSPDTDPPPAPTGPPIGPI